MKAAVPTMIPRQLLAMKKTASGPASIASLANGDSAGRLSFAPDSFAPDWFVAAWLSVSLVMAET